MSVAIGKKSKHKNRFKLVTPLLLLMSSRTISVRGLPNGLSPCHEYYNDEQLRELLGIEGSKCADDYGHSISSYGGCIRAYLP